MKWEKELKLKQVDNMLNKYAQLNISRPKSGWINLIRTTLGMSARSLSKIVGLTQSRISLIEKGEVNGSITLETLNKIANGLNCDVIYYLKPRTGALQSLREEQALKKAKSISQYVEHHMLLEEQSTTKQQQNENIQKLQEEYLKSWSRDLWDIK